LDKPSSTRASLIEPDLVDLPVTGLTPGSWLYSAMSKPDARALAIRFCATLAEDTAGRPMEYRMIAPIMVRARIRGERD
jgi:hypothetical protein